MSRWVDVRVRARDGQRALRAISSIAVETAGLNISYDTAPTQAAGEPQHEVSVQDVSGDTVRHILEASGVTILAIGTRLGQDGRTRWADRNRTATEGERCG